MLSRIHPVHERLAALWVINQKRELTTEEMDEMNMCLKANVSLCWEFAYLENSSIMAKMTIDTDWMNEISIEIDNI